MLHTGLIAPIPELLRRHAAARGGKCAFRDAQSSVTYAELNERTGKLAGHLNDCAELLSRDDGLDATLDAIKTALPPRLRETAYAIACDLIAVDGSATQEELQILDLIRQKLEIDRLIAAALERGARARAQQV